MSRFDTEPAGSSNASIIIKNDSSIDDTDVQPEFGASKRYDLEVQKPSERQKIINDHNFFKSLSYSFYAEPNSSPKSFSSLNHYFHFDENNAGQRKIPIYTNNSDPLANRILSRVSFPLDEPSILETNASSASSKAFKIKTMRNFYLNKVAPIQKKSQPGLKDLAHPLGSYRTITTGAASPKNTLTGTHKIVTKQEHPTPKQDYTAINPVVQLEQFLINNRNSSPKSKLSARPLEKPKKRLNTSGRVSEVSKRVLGSKVSLGTTRNVVSPRSQKTVGTSSRANTGALKSPERVISKTPKNVDSSSDQRFRLLQSKVSPRPSLKLQK